MAPAIGTGIGVGFVRRGGANQAPPGSPIATQTPVVSGTPQQGQTLTVSNGTWTNSPTGYTYQWRRSGAAITGATAQTYTLVAADVGKTISCTVTATNNAGSNYANSNSVGPVTAANAAPVNTAAPVVSGTPTQGETLTTTNGTWTGNPAPTYAYQWLRDGSAISGATSQTYVLVAVDVGTNVSCRVTATNTAGSASQVSNSVGPIAAAATAPTNTVAPVVSGTPTEGQTLTTTNGTWSGNPTPTYTYQWRRNGTAISGATSQTYLLVTADVGANITCAVTATNSAGSATAVSNSVGPVQAAAGAQTFSDDFNRADQTLGTSPNWNRSGGAAGTITVRDLMIQFSGAGEPDTLYYAPDTGSTSHFAQIQNKVPSGVSLNGFSLVICALDENNFIGLRPRGTNWQALQRVAGTFTVLNSGSTIAVDDIWRAERVGNQVNFYRNGALSLGPFTVPSGLLTNTRAGMVVRADSRNPVLDNWQSGPIT